MLKASFWYRKHSTAKESHLRREILHRLHLFQEVTDNLVRLCVIANLLGLLTIHIAASSAGLVLGVERTLFVLDIASVLLLSIDWAARVAYLRNPNRFWRLALGRQDYLELRKWFSMTLHEEEESASICKARFATLDSLEELVKLNFESFKDSIFAIKPEILRERNQSYIRKNQYTFMFFLDPIRPGDPIGYSCLLPLTSEGIRLYLDGKLKDADVPAALVTEANEVPAAVLLFATVIKNDYRLARDGGSGEYSFYFRTCFRKHFRDLFSTANSGPYPPIYAQTERRSLKSRFKLMGFEETGRTSGDGFGILAINQPFRERLK